jgi:hypothetical protein
MVLIQVGAGFDIQIYVLMSENRVVKKIFGPEVNEIRMFNG